MKSHRRIEMNPRIMFGKPVIGGTRVTVELILRKLSEGLTPEEIANEHPTIKKEDVYTAQAFAADYLASDEIIFSESA
jgi:uncharacterized protein (DUF433 family)